MSPVPRVSVVLPVYNGERTLARTVASVLAQTFTDFELLVVDDGSTDGSRAVLAGFDDPRLRVLGFANAGHSASRNRGIRAARAPLVAFIDADDLWLPGKLERQVAALEARPAAALAYAWTDCIDAADAWVGTGSHVRVDGPAFERLLVRNFLDNGSTPLVRAAALAEAGGFDEALPAAEDWDLWLRLAWRHEFACVPEVLVLYRIHGGTESTNVERMERASVGVLEAHVARVEDPAARARLRRAGLAELYRYLTARALRGAGTPAGRALAARCWRAFVRQAPRGPRNAAYAAIQGAKLGLATVLPAPAWDAVLAGLARAHRRAAGR